MRFLVDENISSAVVQSLRDCGHDVLAVKESLLGASDAAILARAQTEARIVVTHDKDFGEMAFRSGLKAACGVILFRLGGDVTRSGQPANRQRDRKPNRLGRSFCGGRRASRAAAAAAFRADRSLGAALGSARPVSATRPI